MENELTLTIDESSTYLPKIVEDEKRRQANEQVRINNEAQREENEEQRQENEEKRQENEEKRAETIQELVDDFYQKTFYYKQFKNTYTTTSNNETTIPIGIEEYNSGTLLEVYINGLRLVETTDYTINATDKTITLTKVLTKVGTKVYFIVLKAVAAQAEDYNLLKGDKGDKGDTGAKGDDGAAATITVGTVTTGEAGANASVENVGTTNAAILNFTIPKGEKGSLKDIEGVIFLPSPNGLKTGVSIAEDTEYSGYKTLINAYINNTLNKYLFYITLNNNSEVYSIDALEVNFNSSTNIATVKMSVSGFTTVNNSAEYTTYFTFKADMTNETITWYDFSKSPFAFYENLGNKPQIGGIELTGNKTLADLGIENNPTKIILLPLVSGRNHPLADYLEYKVLAEAYINQEMDNYSFILDCGSGIYAPIVHLQINYNSSTQIVNIILTYYAKNTSNTSGHFRVRYINVDMSASTISAIGNMNLNPDGLPIGGTTGQVLAKKSNLDNETEWIDLVVDNLESTSTTNALSAKQGKALNDKIMPTVLYMTDGNTVKSDITLNDNVSNYNYLDIQFKKASGGGVAVGYSRIYKENYGMYNALTSSFSSSDNKAITIYSCIISLATNKITIKNGNSIAIKGTGIAGFSNVNELAILSVRGYKIK